MVRFVSFEEALAIARARPVVIAEVVAETNGECALEVHVARAGSCRLEEIERNDTGPIPRGEVEGYVAAIARRYGAEHAAIGPARAHWPPDV